MSDYVFTMYRADKFYGPDRQVLANISLVVPPRREDRRARAERRRQVDAAADHGRPRGAVERRGRARARARPSGCSSRSRSSTRPRTCAATSRTACASCATCSTASTRSRPAFAEPDADFDALLAEQAKVQEQIDRRDAWSLDATLDRAMDALRLPDGDRDVDDALRRRAPARRALPAAALVARPAAARRADEPPRRRVGRAGSSASSPSTRAPSSRSRTTATSSTTSPAGSSSSTAAAGIPFQGNYSSWLEQKQARLAVEEKQESARRRTLARELEWVRMSPRARHAKSKARLGAYEQLLAEEERVKLDRVEIHIPPGPRLGDLVIEAERPREGLRRPAAVRGPDVLAAARRASSA